MAVRIMSALGQPTRLRAYKLLVEAGGDGLASGELASLLGAPHNTMSTHLTVLGHAGLVERQQRGRFATYRAVLEDVAALGAFITETKNQKAKSAA